MTTKPKISNLVELRTEIVRLKQLKTEQEFYLNSQFGIVQQKFQAPINFFNKIYSYFPGSSKVGGDVLSGSKATVQSDWVIKALKTGLPFVVNRMFFPKAGYFKRLVLGLASSQAANLLSRDAVANGINKITHLFKQDDKEKRIKRSAVRAANTLNKKATV